MTEMPHETMTYLRMYGESFPIDLFWPRSVQLTTTLPLTYLRMYCESFPVDLLTSFSSTNYYPTTDWWLVLVGMERQA
jgi:hypothetical protein